MKREGLIITLSVRVDDRINDVKGHAQEKLSPSELITLALLFVIRGIGKRPFYRWLTEQLYPALSELQ